MGTDIKNLIIFYVNEPRICQKFFTDPRNLEAFYSEKSFVLFKLSESTELGLWSQDTVIPKSETVSESQELAFEVSSRELVDSYYNKPQAQGMTIRQAPAELDFGYALTFLDPDGYRLRVYHMEKQA